MKKLLSGVILLAFSTMSLAQQLPPEKQMIKDDLLRKSQNQRKTGWILFGVGAVVATAGTLMFTDNFDFWSSTPQDQSWATAGAIIATCGGISMATSIYFFVSSDKKRKAADQVTAGLKMEQTNPDLKIVMPPTSYPALAIRLNIN